MDGRRHISLHEISQPFSGFQTSPFKSLFCIVMQLNFKHFAPVGSKQVDTSVPQAPHKTLEI